MEAPRHQLRAMRDQSVAQWTQVLSDGPGESGRRPLAQGSPSKRPQSARSSHGEFHPQRFMEVPSPASTVRHASPTSNQTWATSSRRSTSTLGGSALGGRASALDTSRKPPQYHRHDEPTEQESELEKLRRENRLLRTKLTQNKPNKTEAEWAAEQREKRLKDAQAFRERVMLATGSPDKAISERDKLNTIRSLVSNLNAAMMSGRKLYGVAVTSLDALFDAMDRDKGGTIDKEELSLAFRRLSLGLKPHQVDQIMGYFKADRRTGEISRESFNYTMQVHLASHSGTPWKASMPKRSKSPGGTSSRPKSTSSQKDKDNALKMLVSSLNSAFMQGRKLYGKQIRSIDDFFDSVDKDKGGSIDKEELSGALRRLGLGLKQQHIETLMEVFDEDGGGEIERDEFEKILIWGGWGKKLELPWAKAAMKKKKAGEDALQREVSKKDRENTIKLLLSTLSQAMLAGSIDREEFTAALKRLGCGLRENQLNHVMEVFDEDGSGEIDREEFTNTMLASFKRCGWKAPPSNCVTEAEMDPTWEWDGGWLLREHRPEGDISLDADFPGLGEKDASPKREPYVSPESLLNQQGTNVKEENIDGNGTSGASTAFPMPAHGITGNSLVGGTDGTDLRVGIEVDDEGHRMDTGVLGYKLQKAGAHTRLLDGTGSMFKPVEPESTSLMAPRMGKEAPNVMTLPEPDTYKPSWEFDGVGWMMRVPLLDDAVEQPRFGSPHLKKPPPELSQDPEDVNPGSQALSPSMEWKIGQVSYDRFTEEYLLAKHEPDDHFAHLRN